MLTVGDIRAESGRQLGLLEEAKDRRLDRIAEINVPIKDSCFASRVMG